MMELYQVFGLSRGEWVGYAYEENPSWTRCFTKEEAFDQADRWYMTGMRVSVSKYNPRTGEFKEIRTSFGVDLTKPQDKNRFYVYFGETQAYRPKYAFYGPYTKRKALRVQERAVISGGTCHLFELIDGKWYQVLGYLSYPVVSDSLYGPLAWNQQECAIVPQYVIEELTTLVTREGRM